MSVSSDRRIVARHCFACVVMGGLVVLVGPQSAWSQQPNSDAIAAAQTPQQVPEERPEQKKTDHDRSDIFAADRATCVRGPGQPARRGRMLGFDFYLDPLGAMKPGMTFEENFKAGVANKPKLMDTQRKLLQSRYNLEPKLDHAVKMSRGKPVAVGPTARLPEGITWDALGAMSAADIQKKDVFPYKALPHPAQGGGLGGQVFPQMQIEMFPRLERFDVDFDLARGLSARVSAGHVSPESTRTRRRLARRGGLDQQLLPPVQGHPDARAARRPAAVAHAVSARRVQSDRRSQNRPAEPRRDLLRLPRQWPHDWPVPPESRQPAASSGAFVSIRSACAACSTSRSTVRSGACARWKISPNSSSGRRTSTATRSTP